MTWLFFVANAAIIFVAGIRLTESTRIISNRLGFGIIWGGALLLPLATSLPELVTSWRSAVINAPDLAMGNVLGSNLFNLVIIAFIDMGLGKKGALFNRAKTDHILSASLGLILVSFVSFSILVPFRLSIGWLGIDSLLLLVIYLSGSLLISRNERKSYLLTGPGKETGAPPGKSSGGFLTAILTFLLAAFLIFAAGIKLTDTAETLARETGLGQTFVGSLFLAVSTSLPEVATTVAAVRLGMPDMALANIFGANSMNMLLLVVADIFYREAPLLAAVSGSHLVTVSFVVAITSISLFSLMYRSPRKVARMGYGSLLILVGYIVAFIYLYLSSFN